MTLPTALLPAHRGVLAALSARQCCTAATLAADTGKSVQQVIRALHVLQELRYAARLGMQWSITSDGRRELRA